MALNIQIPYRGDAYLYQGISQAGQGLGEAIQTFGQNLKKAKAYRAMAVDALGMEPDRVDKMSLPELEGHFQAQAVKNAMEQTKSLVQERQAKAAQLMMQQEEAAAWPQLMQHLQAQGGEGAAGPNPAELMSPGASAAGAGPEGGARPAGAGPFGQANLLQAMAGMGRTNPRLAAALARNIIPQLMQGGATGPQSFKSPEGNPYVWMGHTILPDRATMDPSSLMGGAPEGYAAVPTGNNKVQYLKTDKALPPSFHSTLDAVQEDLTSAETTLQQPADAFKSAEEAKTMKGYAQRRLDSARARGKSVIDRYHTTGYLTDDQRQSMYGELGMGGAAAAKAAAPSKDARKVVQKDGKKFTVPAEQLADALKQGYTEVK